jgi:hypothetical protein
VRAVIVLTVVPQERELRWDGCGSDWDEEAIFAEVIRLFPNHCNASSGFKEWKRVSGYSGCRDLKSLRRFLLLCQFCQLNNPQNRG